MSHLEFGSQTCRFLCRLRSIIALSPKGETAGDPTAPIHSIAFRRLRPPSE